MILGTDNSSDNSCEKQIFNSSCEEDKNWS